MDIEHGLPVNQHRVQRVGFHFAENGKEEKIDIAQAVAVNYVVAVILTLSVLKPDVGNIGAFLPTW